MKIHLFTRSFPRQSRAFTLIEVLLGILILAIGLLGLGAVFPLVVKQQRVAQDTVVGVSAARGAESYLKGQQGFFSASLQDIVGLNAPSGKSGWAALSWALYQTAWEKDKTFGRLNWSQVFDTTNTFKTAIYGSTAQGTVPGAIYIAGYQNPLYDVIIKPGDRLTPTSQGGADPLFVWDIAPMLASPIDTKNQIASFATFTPLPLRITVFIRRIDQGVRVPSGMTLAEAISAGKVLPVASDKDGLATLSGSGFYSTFFYPSVQTAYRRFGSDSGPFNVISFNAQANSPAMAAARQIGQQLVDTDGNVYTVVALPEETGTDIPYANVLDRSVVIEPGLPTGYLASTTGKSTSSAVRTNREVELLCTPQIPAAVSTFLIRQ